MPRGDDLADGVLHRLLALLRYQHCVGHQIKKTWGISGRHLSVLRYLLRDGPHSVSEISRYLYVSDGTTSPMLERMENAGFVTRHRSHEDSRKVLVEPTEQGLEIVARAPLGPIPLLRAHLPELPIHELEMLHWALGKLNEIAEVDENL